MNPRMPSTRPSRTRRAALIAMTALTGYAAASAQSLLGRSLTGAAAGLRGSRGAISYDLFIGTPLRKPEGFKTATANVGFSLSASF